MRDDPNNGCGGDYGSFSHWNLQQSQLRKISSSLSCNDHTDLIIGRANKMLGITYRTCTTDCDEKTKLILCKSLVRPQLEYASEVWSPYTKEKLKDLERVQRRAIKFILKCDLTYTEGLAKLSFAFRV